MEAEASAASSVDEGPGAAVIFRPAREWIQERLYILTEERGVQLLKFTEIQALMMELIELLRELKLPIRLLVLKARRLRMSTFLQGIIFEDTTHHEGVKSLIVAHEEDSKQTIFDMSRLFYDRLPPEEKPMSRYSSKKELVFENPDPKSRYLNPGLQSSYRVAIAKRKDVGRSQLVHNAHFSEVDSWGKVAPAIMQAILPTIPNIPNTIVAMETTATHGGFGGEFFKRWNGARKYVLEKIRQEPLIWNRERQRMELNRAFFFRVKEETEERTGPYIPLFFPWFCQPHYEITPKQPLEEITEEEQELIRKYDLSEAKLNFRRVRIRDDFGGNTDGFKEEYPADDRECYYSAIRSRFSTAALMQYEEDCKQVVPLAQVGLHLEEGKAVFKEDRKGYLTIYAWPQAGASYGIGGDASAGVKDGDYSVLTVEDLRTGEQMAEWYGWIDPDLLGVEAYKLAIMYLRALVGIENEKHGITALKRLWNGTPEQGIPPYKNVMLAETHDQETEVMTHELGWATNKVTRAVLLDDLAEVVRERAKLYRSIGFVNECFSFVRDDRGKFRAAPGCHDDRVIAYGVAEQVRRYFFSRKAYV